MDLEDLEEMLDMEDDLEDEESDEYSIDSSDFDSDTSDDDFVQCTCYNCKILRDQEKFQYVYVSENDTVFKFDVYHISNHLFNVFKAMELPTSLKFAPMLLRKLKEKMKYGLQEELGRLLNFPGHGYLPNTVQIQIVELLLESSLSSKDRNIIEFEDDPEHIREALDDVYHLMESISGQLVDLSSRSFFRQWNPSGYCYFSSHLIHYFQALIGRAQVLIDFSIEVDHCRAFVRETMKIDTSLDPKEDITELVYALRNDMDFYAEILIPNVTVKDILAMCKISQVLAI